MPLHLDILDVGQGDGMVVWLPNGKVMMVDLGSSKNKEIVTNDVFGYFNDHTSFGRPNPVIDWLVLTHGDSDHYNMVRPFLKRFPTVSVRNILHGGLEADYGSLIRDLRDRPNQDGMRPKVLTAVNGAGFFPLKDLGADVTVLALGIRAAAGAAAYKKNTRSVVLRIVYRGVRIMLTGDATRDTENWIMQEAAQRKYNVENTLGADVLKIGHHGSHRTSNQAAWLKLVNPQFVFISSDRSGSLDRDERATGHRLPQELTLDLVRKYARALRRDCGIHSYVASHQRFDYEQYNSNPDFASEPLPVPSGDDQWVHRTGKEGIFSTLVRIGLAEDPRDPGAADEGVQYRVTVGDNGAITIYNTEDAKSAALSAQAAF